MHKGIGLGILIGTIGVTAIFTVSMPIVYGGNCDIEVRDRVHNPESDKAGTVRYVDNQCNIGIMYDDNTTSKTIANGGISYVIPSWIVNKR